MTKAKLALIADMEHRVVEMKKLKHMIQDVHKYSVGNVPDLVLLGGDASVNGVESLLRESIGKLDRMIKDSKVRLKLMQSGEYWS